MIHAWEARRQVRLHSQVWADEALEIYGDNAAEFLRSVEGGFSRAERYAFRQVRKAIARKQRGETSAPSKLAGIIETLAKGPVNRS